MVITKPTQPPWLDAGGRGRARLVPPALRGGAECPFRQIDFRPLLLQTTWDICKMAICQAAPRPLDAGEARSRVGWPGVRGELGRESKLAERHPATTPLDHHAPEAGSGFLVELPRRGPSLLALANRTRTREQPCRRNLSGGPTPRIDHCPRLGSGGNRNGE